MGGGGSAFVFSFCLLSFCFIDMHSDRMLKWGGGGGGGAFFLHLFASLPPVLLRVSHVCAFCGFGCFFSKG